VTDKLRGLPDFPPRLRSLVEHMILSHHGQLEFGSPKLPQFPEALLLHYLDDMDSKMEAMRALIENDRQVEGCFTSFSPALERTALKKDRYLNPPPPAPPAAPRPVVKPAANGAATVPTPPAPPSVPAPPAAPTLPAPPMVPPAAVAHPLFTPKPDSAFADKLKQALQPAAAKQEN